jgi:pilus assembly protein Flp/PilA
LHWLRSKITALFRRGEKRLCTRNPRNGKPVVKRGRKAKDPPRQTQQAADCQAAERKKTMRKLGQFAVDFLKREDGPTAVEYAVMLALIIVVCIGAITTLGKNANSTFTTVGSAVNVGS